MKLADYVIQYLRDIGIKKVFVVYGAACGDLIDAFTRIEGIDYVAVIHEQAGAFAAETYAKVSGGLSACIVTSGPGGINLLNGIANCYYDSTPCLFITGQVNTQFLKSDPAQRQVGFQENDIVAMARPITKFARMVRTPQSIRYLLEKAVFVAQHKRPGPVLLDIPMDVQKADIEPDQLSGYIKPSPIYSFNERCLAQVQSHRFLQDLKRAKRPVLLIGGGVRGAVKEMKQLAHWLKIPCVPTWNAVDIVTSDDPFYRGRIGTYGTRGGNFTIQNADLLLSIGCRMSGRITGGNIQSFARGAKKYIVDVDRANLDFNLQQVKGDVNIYCDAGQFIDYLWQQAHHMVIPNKTEWLNKTLEWNKKYPAVLPEYYKGDGVNPYVFVKILSEELDAGDVIIADCGGNVVNVYQAFETKWGQRLISSHGNSPMGYSFAGAIGACLVPDVKRVICLIGDGGFNMNIQELQTLINYDLPVKTFIMDNRIYGITWQFQDTHFESRYEACGPKGYNPPDFIKIVNAYGIKTAEIKNHTHLRTMIREVVSCPEAIVCDVNMKYWHTYEPRVIGYTPIEDMSPPLPREEFKGNMFIE